MSQDDDRDLVLVQDEGDGLYLVTMNRPAKLNALSSALRRRLAAAFDELGRTPQARVVILTGAGRAFCAGLDLEELGAREEALGGAGDEQPADPPSAMARFAGPILGAVHGAAVTGGFEIALACDLLIATPEARFADTHARVGIFPGWGLSQRLSRRIGIARAKELSLTGNFLDAATAERWGLVNRVVAEDELLPVCRSLARDMLSVEPQFLTEYKRLIDEGAGRPIAEALELEQTFSGPRNRRVRGADVASRTGAVAARGRAQTARE